jgi:hypothetical protein
LSADSGAIADTAEVAAEGGHAMTQQKQEYEIDDIREMKWERVDEDYKGSFEAELEQLIREHLGKPEWSEDYYHIYRILKEVSHRFDEEADQLPSLRGILDEAAEEVEG